MHLGSQALRAPFQRHERPGLQHDAAGSERCDSPPKSVEVGLVAGAVVDVFPPHDPRRVEEDDSSLLPHIAPWLTLPKPSGEGAAPPGQGLHQAEAPLQSESLVRGARRVCIERPAHVEIFTKRLRHRGGAVADKRQADPCLYEFVANG